MKKFGQIIHLSLDFLDILDTFGDHGTYMIRNMDSTIIDVHDSIHTLIGWDRETILKNPQVWSESIHPNDSKNYYSDLKKVASISHLTMRYRLKNESGHYLEIVETIMNLRNQSYFLSNIRRDTASDVKNSFNKIKTFKQSLYSLQEMKAFENIINKVSTGILILGRQQRVLYVNWAGEEFLGQRKNVIIGSKLPFLKKIRIGMSTLSEEITLNEKSQIKRYLAINSSPIQWANEGLCTLVTVEDQSENRKRNLAEKESLINKKRSEATSVFLANMSHEIRTPLNAIMGMTDLLMEHPLSEEQTVLLERQANAGKTLLAVINDILDISKIEAKQIVLDRNPVNIRHISKNVLDLLHKSADDNGVELFSDIHPRVPFFVFGDEIRIKQILINLLSNAIKFSKDGKVELKILSHRSPDSVGLSMKISDTGIGIPKESIDSIFQNFSQADSTTTRRFGGTGLGLPIVKHLVEHMGGKIYVTSEPGRGSKFMVHIPFEICKCEPKNTTTKPDLDTDIPKLKILVADDGDDNRFLLKHFFKNSSFTLDFAVNGKEAVEKFVSGSWDVVLMDMEMPIMDGRQATREIRKLEKSGEQVPIIAVTAHAFKDQVDEIIGAGCNAYLSKPVRKKDLIEIILKYVRGEKL